MATEITLEKIELVKDRTGVSYKEAKEALEASDGNVVDAIIAIEETINISGAGKARERAQGIVDTVKEYVKKGNVSKIVIKRDEEVVLNLPVSATIVGGLLAPWGFLVGLIASFVAKCSIELIKDDGSVINVSDKAVDKFGDVASKGADIASGLKDKGSDAFDNVKSKAQDVYNQAANKQTVKSEDFKDTVDEMWEAAKKRVEQTEDTISDAVTQAASAFEGAIDDKPDEN